MSHDSPLFGKVLAVVASVCIVGAFLAGMYVAFWPVNVLKDWHIVIVDKPDAYRPGDTIVVKSEYKKLRSVSGTAYRYIECLDNGSWTRFPLTTAQANRRPDSAKQSTGIVMQIPTTLTGLPARCRITISVDYEIYAFRKVNEYAVSNTFLVVPR